MAFSSRYFDRKEMVMEREKSCPDCESSSLNRRHFVQAVGASAAAISAASLNPIAMADEKKTKPTASETLAKKLALSLTDEQKKKVQFDWDHTKKDGKGNPYLLRLHVRNNWQITAPKLNSGFFTADQQEMIEALFWGLYNPEWHERIKKQLKDDAGGYGKQQSIAIFGDPNTEQFEFVMTGRHLTIRCDGNSQDHMAFGGPIFYGHAAKGFTEAPDHPGNVYWHQALAANKLYTMLDGKQRKQALILNAPDEAEVQFRKQGAKFQGIPVGDLAKDQQAQIQTVLKTLIEPYRTSDQDEVVKCLKAQGGLEQCHIAFYESDDVGEDAVWDTWRLEGPAFVWHFRGNPHVHVWVNIADAPSVKISTKV